MCDIELLAPTGNQQVDQILRGVVEIFETIFPDRIRGYYIIGSYADGTAISDVSDIDGFILFMDGFLDGTEPGRAGHTLNSCALLSPLELDLAAVPESSIIRYGHVVLKRNSTLVYGEDIRKQIPLPDIDIYGHSLLFDAYRFLSRVRGNPPFLTCPLDFPDIGSKFYGYDRRRIKTMNGFERASTKELINCVGKAALGIVTVRGRIHVKNKTDCIVQYRKHIDDEWGDFLEDVFANCRDKWHYGIPEDETQQQELRALCRRTLDFENHFLTFYKDFLVKTLLATDSNEGVWIDLQTANMVFLDDTLAKNMSDYNIQNKNQEIFIQTPTKIMAAKALGQVYYPDDKSVIGVLQKNANSQNLILQHFAKKSLQRYL